MMMNVGLAAATALATLGLLALYLRVSARARRAMRRCDQLEAQLDLLFDCSRTLGRRFEQSRTLAAAPPPSHQSTSLAATADRAPPEALPTFATIDPAAVETEWIRSEGRSIEGPDEEAAPAAGNASADAAADVGALSHTEQQLLARLAPALG